MGRTWVFYTTIVSPVRRSVEDWASPPVRTGFERSVVCCWNTRYRISGEGEITAGPGRGAIPPAEGHSDGHKRSRGGLQPERLEPELRRGLNAPGSDEERERRQMEFASVELGILYSYSRSVHPLFSLRFRRSRRIASILAPSSA